MQALLNLMVKGGQVFAEEREYPCQLAPAFTPL
jgi:hypothetical protein